MFLFHERKRIDEKLETIYENFMHIQRSSKVKLTHFQIIILLSIVNHSFSLTPINLILTRTSLHLWIFALFIPTLLLVACVKIFKETKVGHDFEKSNFSQIGLLVRIVARKHIICHTWRRHCLFTRTSRSIFGIQKEFHEVIHWRFMLFRLECVLVNKRNNTLFQNLFRKHVSCQL